MASFAVMQMHASAMAGQVNLGRSKASLQPSGRSGCITPKLRFVVRAHGHGTTEQRMRPGEKKGFVEEMRFVAMKLHTKEQAPKEGEAKPAPQPMKQWVPTREGYLQYLAESQIVYAAMEKIMKDAPVDSYKFFQNTGLEREGALEKDIAWFKATYGMEPKALEADGPGTTYKNLLEDLAVSDPPAFICHFYNVFFAHTAGGRMIGRKMSEMLLDGKELEFYNYETDYKELLDVVRSSLNTVAEGWTAEQKKHCLEETEASFKYSGLIMRAISS